jgi:tetratricopeptide (TPR) repeat protein
MALAFAGALVVGYLLLPDDNERIASLERDGHVRQALELLENRFAAGDRSQRTLFQLQSLYQEKGDIARARTMLELLAAVRPRDANVQRHLSELYRATQDEAAYIRTLETRLEGRFSQPVCKELIGLYRGAGNFEAEMRTLTTCRAKGYRRTDDMIRFAHLTAVDGNFAEAAILLRAVDDRRQLRIDSDRLMLFNALLEAGAAEEAKRRAARWFKGSKDDGLVLQIIDTLAADNRHELAIELAREVGRPGDSIALAVAELMLDREEIVAARGYLRDWLERARLTEPEMAQRAIRAALDAEDPMLAYQAAQAFGPERLLQEDLVALAEALSAVDQTAAFQSIRALIAPGSIRENLLLAAAVEVDEGKPEPARQLLSRIQVKALDDWRLALWARLMASTGRGATAQQTLRDIAAEVTASGGRAGPAAFEIPGAAPTPTVRPEPVIPAPAPPVKPVKPPPGVKRTPFQAVPGDPFAPPKLIRRNRIETAGQAPRRSRLKRAAPPVALPKAPPKGFSFPTPAPFPSPG